MTLNLLVRFAFQLRREWSMSNLKTIRYSQFFHRRNADATIDSICGVCFLTVASAMNEEEVRAQEAYHRCPDRKSGIGAK